MTEKHARPPARGGKSRDALVLLLSGLVVLGGAAAVRRSSGPEAATAADPSSPRLPPPLPSGAPPRGLEDLPADDAREVGCRFSERGFGDYGAWRRLPLGKALVPAGRAVAADGSFPLLVHFHGAEPVRKQLAPEGFDLVIAAVDAGVGSHAYERALADDGSGAAPFARLVAAVEAEVAAANGLPAAHAGPIAISSWSAGYGAVGQILARPRRPIAALILLDSLYAGYPPGKRVLEHGQLGLFLDAARAGRGGGPLFYLTHTAIATPGYASTGEVASFLLAELGARATAIDANGDDPHPLRRMFEEGRLAIRGYGGNDRDAHCAQLHLLPSVLREAVLPSFRR